LDFWKLVVLVIGLLETDSVGYWTFRNLDF
jgi:hypothetical protein